MIAVCKEAIGVKAIGVRSTRAVAQKPNPKISENLTFDE